MDYSLDYLFNEVPLYSSLKFQLFDEKEGLYTINSNVIKELSKLLGMTQETIVTKCNKCKMEFPFTVSTYFYLFNKNLGTMHESNSYYIDIATCYNDQGGLIYNTRMNIASGNIKDIEKHYIYDNLNSKIYYLIYFFKCTKNNEHNYMMFVSIELNKDVLKVRKIGQNPSIASVKSFEFNKFEKQLERFNAFDEYKKADECYVENYCVGAYAYLRRVFEKMLNSYIEGKDLKDNHIETKISEAKSCFDPSVFPLLSNLYNILSASIHEISEEESVEFYSYLKAIIDMQLEYDYTNNEKDKLAKSLKNVTDKIKNLHTKK